jgi:FkbM family methyltransferase
VQATVLALGGGDVRGWTCWDLGAHYGLYSVGLARLVGETGQVAAFEPNPASCARLRRHAAMNRVPWLRVFEAAVSDRTGQGEMYTYGDLDTTITHLPYDEEVRQDACRPISVEIVELDRLVEAGSIRPPRFVKIDVEGHGHRALGGMRRTLQAHMPVVMAAFHSQHERDGMAAMLAALGYVQTSIGPSVDSRFDGTDYLFTPGA